MPKVLTQDEVDYLRRIARREVHANFYDELAIIIVDRRLIPRYTLGFTRDSAIRHVRQEVKRELLKWAYSHQNHEAMKV